MRLSKEQRTIIRTKVKQVLGENVRIWLFGSRVDDAARGGDIDLYLECDKTLPNRAEALCRLEGALVMALGDRKFDLLLKDEATPNMLIFDVAKEKGLLL